MLEDAPARFRVAIAPDLARQMKPDDLVAIQTADKTLPARLSELSPELDPATRSQVAFFDLDPGAGMPPARATGTLILADTQQVRGAWVPLSALRQGPRGAWTLMTVAEDENGTPVVGVEAAEILRLDAGRAFVRGSFSDGTQFLPHGTHRVVPGESVRLTGAETG